jgi:hypothetical protein
MAAKICICINIYVRAKTAGRQSMASSITSRNNDIANQNRQASKKNIDNQKTDMVKEEMKKAGEEYVSSISVSISSYGAYDVFKYDKYVK